MRAVADLTRGVVHANIEIAAPPERVFDALTEPEQLASWWGGEEYQTHGWQVDLRPGGQWSCQASSPRGATSVHGEYLEVDPPRRVVYTWLASWDEFQRTVITIELTAVAGGTRVTVVHDGFGSRVASVEGHAAGWERVLGWLASHAEVGAPR